MESVPKKLDHYISIQHRARPLRFLFLVENNAKASNVFDEIFEDAYKRWAGCRTLLVPVENGRIEENYLAWIHWYDPDIIYSYAQLDNSTITELDQRASPISFLKHTTHHDDSSKSWAKPNYQFQCVTALSILPALKKEMQPPKSLISAYYDWQDDGFLKDSFGAAEDREAKNLYLPLTLTPENLNPRMLVHGEKFHSTNDLLKRLGTNNEIISLAQLSNKNCGMDVPEHNYHWCESLNLVVGDSFEDRLYFWNSRHFVSESKYSDITTLRVPASKLDDEEFIGLLATYLNKHQYKFPGNSGQRSVSVRSYSLDGEILEKFIQKLREKKCYLQISQQQNQLPIPKEFNQERRPSQNFRQTDRITENPSSFYPAEPDHFYSILPDQSQLMSGRYAVDILLERYQSHCVYSNGRHWWLLPRKSELCRLFVKQDSKIRRNGVLSVLHSYFQEAPFNEDRRERPIEIGFPDDNVLFRAIFYRTSYYPKDDLRYKDAQALYEVIAPSDKGRSLHAVTHMFQGLARAHRFISNKFWRDILNEAANYDHLKQNTSFAERIQKALKKQLGEKVVIEAQNEWDKFTAVIVRAMYHLPQPGSIISYSVMKKKRAESFNKFKKTAQSGQGFNAKDVQKDITENFDDALAELVSSKIFFQGYEWPCRKCGSTNWSSVDNLKTSNICEVCGREKNIPPQGIEWDYSINKRLLDALYKDSILADMWALGTLLEHAFETFYYVPQSALYKKYDDPNPCAEVDILCIREGMFIMGEAKSKSSGFTEKKIKALLEIAEDVSPDVILLACIENDDSNIVTTARQLVVDAGFKFELLCANQNQSFSRDDPWSIF